MLIWRIQRVWIARFCLFAQHTRTAHRSRSHTCDSLIHMGLLCVCVRANASTHKTPLAHICSSSSSSQFCSAYIFCVLCTNEKCSLMLCTVCDMESAAGSETRHDRVRVLLAHTILRCAITFYFQSRTLQGR